MVLSSINNSWLGKHILTEDPWTNDQCGVEGKIVSNVSRSTNIIDDDGDDSEKEMESDQTINLLARRHIALTGHFSVQKRVK